MLEDHNKGQPSNQTLPHAAYEKLLVLTSKIVLSSEEKQQLLKETTQFLIMTKDKSEWQEHRSFIEHKQLVSFYEYLKTKSARIDLSSEEKQDLLKDAHLFLEMTQNKPEWASHQAWIKQQTEQPKLTAANPASTPRKTIVEKNKDLGKTQKKRDLVITELLATEKTYFQKLDAFVKRLEKMRAVTDNSPHLNQFLDNALSGLKPIHTLAEDFQISLGSLSAPFSTEDIQKISELFIKKIGFYETIYASYLYGSREKASTSPIFGYTELTQYLENNDKRLTMKDREKIENARVLLRTDNLTSLLILPVQRIPRYKLLLQEIIKNLPQEYSDHGLLEKALSKVSEAGIAINNTEKVRNLLQNNSISISSTEDFFRRSRVKPQSLQASLNKGALIGMLGRISVTRDFFGVFSSLKTTFTPPGKQSIQATFKIFEGPVQKNQKSSNSFNIQIITKPPFNTLGDQEKVELHNIATRIGTNIVQNIQNAPTSVDLSKYQVISPIILKSGKIWAGNFNLAEADNVLREAMPKTKPLVVRSKTAPNQADELVQELRAEQLKRTQSTRLTTSVSTTASTPDPNSVLESEITVRSRSDSTSTTLSTSSDESNSSEVNLKTPTDRGSQHQISPAIILTTPPTSRNPATSRPSGLLFSPRERSHLESVIERIIETIDPSKTIIPQRTVENPGKDTETQCAQFKDFSVVTNKATIQFQAIKEVGMETVAKAAHAWATRPGVVSGRNAQVHATNETTLIKMLAEVIKANAGKPEWQQINVTSLKVVTAQGQEHVYKTGSTEFKDFMEKANKATTLQPLAHAPTATHKPSRN